jgi:hypothetical protein
MAVSCLTGVAKGLLRKEEAVIGSEIIEFVIMLCGVAMLFYTIGRDKNENKSEEKNTKK